MRSLTIHYDVPGMSPHGQLLDDIVLQPTLAAEGVAFIVDPTANLPQPAYQIVARATRHVANTLAVRARSLTVRCTSHNSQRTQNGHDCSAEGDAVLDLTLDKQFVFNVSLALLRARDLLSGRFPSIHSTARVPWIDVLWTLSLEHRLAMHGIVRASASEPSAQTERTVRHRSDNELLTSLFWAGKQRGLSISRNDTERLADLVRCDDVSLHELVALGGKFGFRCEGPLASIPLPEIWPRHVTQVLGVRPTRNGKQVVTP